MNLEAYKAVFDPLFKAKLAQETENVPEDIKNLLEEATDMLTRGGKRFRAYLADVRGETVSQKAMAVELLHGFALIHDDLMDGAKTRRGGGTVHENLQHPCENEYDARSKTGAMTILLGDFFLSLANAWFYEKEPSQNQKTAWAKMQREVVLGQMLDVRLKHENTATIKQIEQKTYLKTATYSFTRPLQIGLNSDKNWTEHWGKSLGLGFQMQDDLLDIFGEEKQTGKEKMGDIKEKQWTMFRFWFEEKADKSQKETLEKVMRGEYNNADMASLEKAFVDLGIRKLAEAEIEKYFKKAKNETAKCEDEKAKEKLEKIIIAMEKRNG